MKYHLLFSGEKNKKNIISLSSSELANRVVMVMYHDIPKYLDKTLPYLS